MSDEHNLNDPSTWPAELQEQWAACRLPSLEDFLTATERLAVEVRRQNRELQSLASQSAQREDIARCMDEALQAHSPAQPAEAQPAKLPAGLLSLADAIDRLVEGIGRSRAEIDQLLPNTVGLFKRRPPWRKAVVDRCQAQVDGAQAVAERLRDLLTGTGLEVIRPAIGSDFDPACHRAVETASGRPGSIVKLLRPGYRQAGTILRPAEVAVAPLA